MLHVRTAGLGIILMFATASSLSAATTVKTWKGWFTDLSCASGRAHSGTFTRTNPECARKCIDSGVPAAFISDEAKTLLRVVGRLADMDDIDYYVEVTGDVDSEAKTISVRSVKRLEMQGASCARPKTAAKK